MPRKPPNISLAGLVVAPAVAPALSIAFASIFLFLIETLPFLLHLANAPQTDQTMFGFGSLGGEVGEELMGVMRDLLSAR